MNPPSAARPRELGRTLLLYCPYDRKVTRHARQGPELSLVCLDCGRGLDAEAQTKVRSASGARRPRVEAEPANPLIPVQVEQLDRPELPPVRFRPLAAARAPESPSRTQTRVRQWPRLPLSPRLAAAAALVALLAGANVVGQFVGPARDSAGYSVQIASDVAFPVVYVANTDQVGVYLRGRPDLADRLYPVPEGTRLKLLGSDIWANGLLWQPVEAPDGTRGWVPSQYTSTFAPGG